MSSEGFKSGPTYDFEKRMQKQFIVPMSDELDNIENFFPSLDRNSKLADALRDLGYELNTMPEKHMDENELSKNLENLRITVQKLQNTELTEEEKIAIAIEGIKSAY